ncbi:MAG: ComEC family competence protein [Psychroserpens sp.]|nr:ComEC family competence protein [Psychroserpens sp.]
MIKLTACLIFGILIAHYLNISILKASVCIGITVFIFSFVYLFSQKAKRKTVIFGILSYSLMIGLGILTYTFNDQRNWPSHYTKISDLSTSCNYQIQIIERLKPGKFQDKYTARLMGVNFKACSGKLLLNLKRDSINKALGIDDIFLISAQIEPIKPPLNPNQFNYKNHLKRQYIYHQLSVAPESLLPISNKSHSIIGYASKLRDKINDQLVLHKFNPQQLAIINALFLGQRQDLDLKLYQNYVKAGAIHILAISGLHVGIILIMLNHILGPLIYLKHGRLVKAIILLILLWSFTIIAGLSASVTRAVTMFSIFAIAMQLKRPSNVYNTLAISIFFLVLVKPMFLFHVGFQMSYVAVLAIVSIQPELYKLWRPKFKPINYLWQIFTVTLAAQIGVAPLSLFYFHQFPSLFFLSNMAIIPFLGFLLGFGLIVIGLATTEILPSFLASLFAQLIDLMNSIVGFVSSKEQFVVKNISFELTELISSYVLIVLLYAVIKLPNYKRIRQLLIGLLIVQLVYFAIQLKEPEHTFIIFHKSRKTLLGLHRNKELMVWHNLDSMEIHKSKEIQDYCVANHISTVNHYSVQNIYKTKSNLLMVIDSIGIYNVRHFKPQFILLRNSPKINLTRLIDSLRPIEIIADGSNYKSYVKRWKATCDKQKLPFHSTYEKGAYIIK